MDSIVSNFKEKYYSMKMKNLINFFLESKNGLYSIRNNFYNYQDVYSSLTYDISYIRFQNKKPKLIIIVKYELDIKVRIFGDKIICYLEQDLRWFRTDRAPELSTLEENSSSSVSSSSSSEDLIKVIYLPQSLLKMSLFTLVSDFIINFLTT